MTRVTGIGVDIVPIDRVRRHTTANPAFAFDAFTPRELTQSAESPERLAGRWAAKEAVMKALGTGLGTVDPHDIEIIGTDAGQPYVELHRAAATTAAAAGVSRIHVSISHDGGHAIAFAVTEGDAA